MRSHPNRQGSRFNPYSTDYSKARNTQSRDVVGRFQTGLEGEALLAAEKKGKKKKKPTMPEFSFMAPPPEEEFTEE